MTLPSPPQQPRPRSNRLASGSTQLSRRDTGAHSAGTRQQQGLHPQPTEKRAPHRADRRPSAGGCQLHGDLSANRHQHRQHEPTEEQADSKPALGGPPVRGQQQRAGGRERGDERQYPRRGIDLSRGAHEIEYGAAGIQPEQRREPLSPDPLGGRWIESLQNALDQHADICDGDQHPAVASLDHGVVRIENRPAKHGGKSPAADDPTGQRPHERPDRHQIATANPRDRVRQMISDVVLDGRVTQRRHGTVGERAGCKQRTAQIGERQRQDRKQHRHAHEPADRAAPPRCVTQLVGRLALAQLHWPAQYRTAAAARELRREIGSAVGVARLACGVSFRPPGYPQLERRQVFAVSRSAGRTATALLGASGASA